MMETAEESGAPVGLIERTYLSPVVLEGVGPLVPATWSVPPHVALVHLRTGRPPPGPVEGYVLIDTGASRTCIAEEVATELGLSLTAWERSHGVTGGHDAAIYVAELHLRVASVEAGDTFMGAVVPAMAVPGLASALPLRDGDGDARIVGLLGRDFLRHVVFTYDGPSGRIRIEVDGRVMARPG